jgi:hypothetical protein
VFAGALGRFPIGGHAWIDLHYLLGLRSLGHEVFYLEDCGEGSWVYDWEAEQLTTDLAYPCAYIRSCLEPHGLGDRWTYRAADVAEGCTLEQAASFCASADLLVVRGSPITIWREEYDWPRRRAYIDVDPPFSQFSLIDGRPDFVETARRCEHLFTIAQRIEQPDCLVPDAGRKWLKTVSPVFLPEWPVAQGEGECYTTIMQWRSYPDKVFEGRAYGNKDREFPAFMDLPGRADARFRMAVTGLPPEVLTRAGWEVEEGWVASKTPNAYRAFIQRSRGEFTVAKHAYVQTRCGWFSDRTACYLASGRPAIVQDTGLSDWLPLGEGLLAFSTLDQAVDAVARVEQDYDRHRRAARQIAERYFDSSHVLKHFLERALE